jgi:RNA polymerase sigma-70 factor (ECF subfamily)
MATSDAAAVAEGEDYRPPVDEPSDYLLLGRYRAGSEEAARHLYQRYAGRLRALARARCATGLGNHLDADDIVQSVFGTFFEGARHGRYDIPDGEDLWKLFLVLALNRIRAEGVFHRAAKRDVRLTAPLERLPPGSEVKVTGRHSAEGFLKLVVEEALERLPPSHRAVVQLRSEGYAVAEIADRLGRSKRSVERVLRESRDRLSVILQDS